MTETSNSSDPSYRGVRAKVTKDLVEDLEKIFGENTRPDDPHGAVMFRAGERSVVRFLRRVYQDQVSDENTHVLPRRTDSRGPARASTRAGSGG